MATTGILPSYQRFLNGAPVPSSTRRSFRPREKYLILLVFFTFGVVCFGAFFFLPEFRGAGTVNSVYKVYRHMQKAGPELLIPAPPHEGAIEAPGKLALGLLRHNAESHQDPHKLEDKIKLQAKIEEEDRKNQKVLERPDIIGESMNKPSVSSSTKTGEALKPLIESVVDIAEIASKIQTVAPQESDNYPVINGGEDKDPTTRVRRDKVKEMMKHAWDNYVRYAWGKNELRPVTKRGHSSSIFGLASLGATILDGLDTLYIMGLMDEFRQAREWVVDNYSLDHTSIDLSVFETNIRFVGGLLTCFALTGDVMFRDKAEHTAQKLLPAFQTQTGIPNAIVNTKTGTSKNYGWASGGSSILSEFGTLALEFNYLSDVTGDGVYRDKVAHIREVMKGIEKPHGLYPNYFNPKTGKWGQHHMSMGALGDSFFEYLLKEWIRSGREDVEARAIYDEAMQSVMTHMLRTSASGLMYFSDLKFDRLEHKMDHLACFSGGLLALGAHSQNNQYSDRYMEVAQGITHTCHESYDRTPTKLGPESFRFTEVVEAKAIRTADKYYILRPEVVESYFYLWRITKDPKYREWGWEAVQALQENCWTPGGYTGIKNVYMEDSQQDDVQQSFFLAETLKYLYLLFSDDSLISLDEWVFNTEGHPVPIKGGNPYYRAAPVPKT